MNRTLLNKVRCLLAQSGLPKSFWGEPVTTACYLINLSPSSAIGFKTPMEEWTGECPSYKHLKVFGCIAYAYVNQGKLEPRAVKCIFLGYPEGVKGYRLWKCHDAGDKLSKSKMIISRDVTFNEDVLYKDIVNESDTNDDKNGIQYEVEP